jgi:prepilin-type processing-associated H-X9-DG protein/prepilin-type N-terminal cleavage/methylation domain-containing protein
MRRRGLTVVEVLVVLGIVAILLAILLPAIQMAREASRRKSCSNRFRQVGLALVHYEELHEVFPPRVIIGRIDRTVHRHGAKASGPWNEKVLLLPYVGAKELYNSINLHLSRHDKSNTTALAISPSQYLCPSDSRALPGSGVTNFKACVGSGKFEGGLDAPIDTMLPAGRFPDGLFATFAGFKAADVRDGLAQTSAMSETRHGGEFVVAPGTHPPLPTLGLLYTFAVTPRTQRNVIAKCENLTLTGGLGMRALGQDWAGGVPYTHLLTPGRPSCMAEQIPDAHNPITANSHHIGGVNVLFADGHVQFIENAVDAGVWQALGSRAAGDY